MRNRIVAAIAACVLSSCAGGGMSSPTIRAATGPAPSSTPAFGTPDAGARFTITVPNAPPGSSTLARHRQYVSTATKSIVITLFSVSGNSYTGSPSEIAANLTPSSANCSGSPLTCTVTAPAVAGTDLFHVVTYDATQTSTAPATPAGNVLSQATVSVPVTGGTTNTANPLVLSGVVNSIDVGLSPSSVIAGTATHGITVTVNARDASSEIIMGDYVDANGDALAIDLADSDTSGHTTLSPASVSNSSTSVTLDYDGTNISSPAITPSASGGSIPGANTAATLTVNKPAPPTLTSLSQNVWVTGPSTTTFTETLTGTNFTSVGTSVALADTGGAVLLEGNPTINGASSITITIGVSTVTPVGTSITVTTPGGTTAGQALSIENGFIVTSSGDTMPGSPLGTGPGAPGDLRYAMQNVSAGEAIVFDCGSSSGAACNVGLTASLPGIDKALTIDGGGYTTIDGASAYRAFFVDAAGSTSSVPVTFEDLDVTNVMAKGGNGVDGGGGGLGAGAGIFVNGAEANVTVSNVAFAGCAVVGGNGSAIDFQGSDTYVGFGGGGGMGADGGDGDHFFQGGGGGGILSVGGTVPPSNMTASYNAGGGGAGYGGAAANGAPGAGGAAYVAGDSAGATAAGGTGGAGGFGGGGGAASKGSGGSGGFGGGGGTGGFLGPNDSQGQESGGAGGPGGGGGAIYMGTPGAGGRLSDEISGGAGQTGQTGSGGNGDAVGPAIFVATGTLTTSASTATGCTASALASSDATPVFNYQGSVNGNFGNGSMPAALDSPSSAMATRRGATSVYRKR